MNYSEIFEEIANIEPLRSRPIKVNRKYPNIVKVNNIPVKYIKRIPNKNNKNDKILVYDQGEINSAELTYIKNIWNNLDRRTSLYINIINANLLTTVNNEAFFYANKATRYITPLLSLRAIDHRVRWNISYASTGNTNRVINSTDDYPIYRTSTGLSSNNSSEIWTYEKLLEIDDINRILYFIKPKYRRLIDGYTNAPRLGATITINNDIVSINSRDKPDGGKYNYILKDNAVSVSATYTVKELEWKTVTGTRTPPGSENSNSYTEDIYRREEKYVDGRPTGEYRNETITGSNRITWKDENVDRVVDEGRQTFGPGYTHRWNTIWDGDRRRIRTRIHEGKITESYTKVTYRDYKKRKYKNDIATDELKLIRTEVVKRESVYWKMERTGSVKVGESCSWMGSSNEREVCTIKYADTYGEVEYVNNRKTGNIRNRYQER